MLNSNKHILLYHNIAPQLRIFMKRILTIGGALQDVFMQPENSATLRFHTEEKNSYICMRAGAKIEIKNLLYYCGGGAANAAVSFARSDFDTSIFCKIGTDHAADFIRAALHKEHVHTQYVHQAKNESTGTSFIIPGPNNNNAVLVYRGVSMSLTEKELPASAIAESDQLYITSLNGPAAPLLIPITQIAKKYNKPVAVNPGTSQLHAGADYLKEALKNIDILILNSYEAELLMESFMRQLPSLEIPQPSDSDLPELLKNPLGTTTASFTLQQFFAVAHGYGPTIIVVTNGAEGVYASDKNTIYFHPSIKVTIVSSTGAGDAFGSCFVAQLNQGASIEDALRAGVINSASVIQHLGTQTGLLKKDEIEKKRAKLDKSLLKKYKL
jgi:ribokinase